jgi:hypothetical protein
MPLVPTCGDYEGVEEKPFKTLDFDQLDYGIYWFGRNNRCQKAVPGYTNPYFDPARPTVIYIHGWEMNTTADHFRESFYLKPGYPDVPEHFNTANAWIDAGWNIGIFYWNQFSDDTSPDYAEAKIYTEDGPVGMRWRKYSGDFAPGPSESVGELFYQAYVSAFAGSPGEQPRIRLVGHSLGAQLAVYGAHVISERQPDLLPERISLLDPHFSLGSQLYLVGGPGGDAASERARNYVDNLKAKGVIFDQYQTTIGGDLTAGFLWFGGNDANPGLKRKTAFARLHLDYVPLFQLGLPFIDPITWFKDQHIGAISWYFWSFSYPEIKHCSRRTDDGIDTSNNDPGPSARSSNEAIRALMSAPNYYEQAGGVGSADPGKVCYDLKKR